MKRIMFTSIIFGFIILTSACDKKYTCTCTSISKNLKMPIESIKTTKLGSKGYAKTCLKHQDNSSDLKDCHLE